MTKSTTIMLVIDEINTLFDDFCEKIKGEHHKEMDGVWSISFNRWHNTYYITHKGYWLDYMDVEKTDLLEALKRFKRKVKTKMEKEISEYDFKQHCSKEFSE